MRQGVEDLLMSDNIAGPLQGPIEGRRMFKTTSDSVRLLIYDSGVALGDLGTGTLFPPPLGDPSYTERHSVVASTVMVVKNRKLIDIADSILNVKSIEEIRLGPSVYQWDRWAWNNCTFLDALHPSQRRGQTWDL